MPRRLFPGGGNTWSVPFCICDLQFFISEHTFCTSGEPLSDLQHSDFSSLVFNDQHNAVRREYIVNGRCGHTHDCDILWILSCVRCLNSCVAPATTPLCAIHISTGWHSIRNAKITSTLRSACDTSVYRLGITSHNLSTHSLWYGGEIPLLLGNINPNTIQIICRWRSDEMLQYLHVTSNPLMCRYTATMVSTGWYTLTPMATSYSWYLGL